MTDEPIDAMEEQLTMADLDLDGSINSQSSQPNATALKEIAELYKARKQLVMAMGYRVSECWRWATG